MRIKLDENLPHRLVPLLIELGHDVDTVLDEKLAGQDDEVVWEAAQTDGRFLVTQDLDFSDARKYVPGRHYGLLLVRLPEPGRSALFERVATLFRSFRNLRGSQEIQLIREAACAGPALGWGACSAAG